MQERSTSILKSVYSLIGDFFAEVIPEKSIKREYESAHYPKLLNQIRIAHFFAVILFMSFAIFDFFVIEDREILWQIERMRIGIFLAVFVPFHILSYYPVFKKIIRPALFINYLVMGSFISYGFLVFNPDFSDLTHKYYGLDLIILGVFILQTVKLRDSIILALLLIVIYNWAWVLFLSKDLSVNSEIFNFLALTRFNVWLIVVVIFGSLIWAFTHSLSQKNFLVHRDLNKQTRELKKSNDIKNNFFNLLTHDLKNHIGSQHSLTSFLVENYGKTSKEKETELMRMLKIASGNTLDLFNELVLWVQAQNSEIVIEPQRLNLANEVDKVHRLIELELNKKGIRLLNQVPTDLMVVCDENSLKTILRNLIGNALKFSFENSQIEVTAFSDSNKVFVSVKDYGVGMNDEKKAGLLELDRIQSSFGTQGETGTGLGLMLIKDLLVLNKGELFVESEDGKGTKMTFALPN